MNFVEITQAFQDADNAWHAELVRLYGRNAQDIRYTSLARGEEGSALRSLWEARCKASDAWTQAKQFQ